MTPTKLVEKCMNQISEINTYVYTLHILYETRLSTSIEFHFEPNSLSYMLINFLEIQAMTRQFSVIIFTNAYRLVVFLAATMIVSLTFKEN